MMSGLRDTGRVLLRVAIDRGRFFRAMLAVLISIVITTAAAADSKSVFPGQSWVQTDPGEVNLDISKLDEIAAYLGGRGCIVRHGSMVYSWGNINQRGDVASAVKPWYAHFLFQAVENGLLNSLDALAADYEPRLADINAGLGNKDSQITFRQMANQTSCYGVSENPGEAFNYNDWQMALFFDTLFLEVYGQTLETVDMQILRPQLTDVLQCEDNPTFLAFGTGDRPGRLAISPRDFARFGLLYLNQGRWNGNQILDETHARLVVSNPLSNTIPRTTALAADMIQGQRSIGSTNIPDDQFDHLGSYSWSWWINGADRNGNRFWPDVPLDAYATLGHQNGRRGLAVTPSLDIVIAWNDTTLDQHPSQPHPLTEVFRLLREAAADEPMDG
jgi:CubicO group peptidase (beta-lactamase class C family)